MTSGSTFPLGRAARGAVAAAGLLLTSVALAQDQTPAPDQTPPADATAPAENAAPADAAAPAPAAPAPETTPVIPVATEKPAPPPAAKDATQLETVEVTGSRLKRTDYESAQPIVSISREDIERTGLTDISDILRKLSVAGNSSLTAQQGRFSESLGETNLDLRNLGAQHTLILVNGRRWVTGLIPTAPSVSDLNTIPTAIIERIEILKDGASAIYGSDAIGGVVNIITRKDYEGFGVNYQLGNYVQQGDGTNQQASLSWGLNHPGTSLFVNLSYTDQAGASNENRSITASPAAGPTRNSIVTPRGTYEFIPTQNNATFYQCPNLQGNIAGDVAGPGPAYGPLRMTGAIPAGVVLCILQRNINASNASGAAAAGDFHERVITDPNDSYNRFAAGSLQEPNTRSALYTQFSQDLFEHVTFTFEGLYNQRKSTGVGQNGYLIGGNLAPGAGYLGAIPATHSLNPFSQDIGIDSSCGGNPTSPSCTGLGVGSGIWIIRQSNPALNNDLFLHTVKTLRLGGGLKGDFELFGTPLSWDGGYLHSTNKIHQVTPGVRYDKDQQALDEANCVSPCVPLDPFHGEAGLTQAMVNFLMYDSWQDNSNQQDIGYLDLSGDLPEIPWLAGPIAAATGIEIRRDGYVSTIDPLVQQNLVAYVLNEANTAGATSSREAYLEFGIPLLKDLPLANVVNLDIAGRYSQYPQFGNVTTGKAGLEWKPIDDLLLRSTISTGFRAPNVGELFVGKSQSFDGLTDPCANNTDQTTVSNCAADGAPGGGNGGQVTAPYDVWQGNPNLKPENSHNLTYGLVYSPHWVPDLNLNVDFYDIEIKNYIVVGLGQYFLDSCYTLARPQGAAPKSGPYCNFVNRDASGTLTFVDTPYFNYSAVKTSGIDGGVDYLLPLPEYFGRFKMGVDASYLKSYDVIVPQPGGADTVTGVVGSDTGQFTGFPRWKAGANLVWKRELYSASWTTRMAYQMTEPCGDLFDAANSATTLAAMGLCSDPTPKTDAAGNTFYENKMKTVFYHNVQVGRELPDFNADITLGINNVLNQDPPLSRSNIGIFWYNYDPNQYEVPGRFAYLRTSFKF